MPMIYKRWGSESVEADEPPPPIDDPEDYNYRRAGRAAFYAVFCAFQAGLVTIEGVKADGRAMCPTDPDSWHGWEWRGGWEENKDLFLAMSGIYPDKPEERSP